MEKIQSLADFLGTTAKVQAAEDLKSIVEDISDSKAFALALIGSIEFRRYIINGLTLGDLPAAVVCRILDHGWGKPVDRVEVKDTTDPLDDLDPSQMEERAFRLWEVAKQLRLSTSEAKAVH